MTLEDLGLPDPSTMTEEEILEFITNLRAKRRNMTVAKEVKAKKPKEPRASAAAKDIDNMSVEELDALISRIKNGGGF